MSKTFQRYMQLRTELRCTRQAALGKESDAEDAILDKMDSLWYSMTNEERQRIEDTDPNTTKRTNKT